VYKTLFSYAQAGCTSILWS